MTCGTVVIRSLKNQGIECVVSLLEPAEAIEVGLADERVVCEKAEIDLATIRLQIGMCLNRFRSLLILPRLCTIELPVGVARSFIVVPELEGLGSSLVAYCFTVGSNPMKPTVTFQISEVSKCRNQMFKSNG